MYIQIPPLNWFESNPWAKVGNCFTGSKGANSIHNNAFLIKIDYYRPQEGDPYLEAQVYDSISMLNKDEESRVKKDFCGTEDGRNEMIEWIDMQYEEFRDSPRSKEKIKY